MVSNGPAQVYAPLTRADFKAMVGPGAPMPQGFGDRQNSWLWSTAWYQGKLVVGTNRSYDCMVQASVNRAFFGIYPPYPPLDKDELCTANYRDLPLQAEIWTWTPTTGAWSRVYQSPADVPIPDAPAKRVADDVGYRYMFVFHEPDGTDALYISGLSSRFIYGASVPNGRLLRTTDLVNFSAVPAPKGTVLGDLPNAGFRGITSYKNKMYIIAGTIEGDGVVLEATDPRQGGNNFRVITPPGMVASEIEVFNDYLYLSLTDDRGFRVVKTNAVEAIPGAGYTFQEVIPFGGGRTDNPNRNVWSMKEFNGRLYIGGNGIASFFGAELYRINPDDTWELVSGEPRVLNGVQKNPISGLGPGFGWLLNAHMWRQAVFDGRLYIGTFDMTTIFKDIPFLSSILSGEMGADLWQTTDGQFYSMVDDRGFGDKFNFGFRGLQTTPYGLFAGTANYYYGLQIYLGQPFGFTTGTALRPSVSSLAAPTVFEIEQNSGKTLLSWEKPAGATSYQVFRSTHGPVNGFQSQGATSPILLAGNFGSLGLTDKNYFRDTTATTGSTYTYYVLATDATGRFSTGSNVAMYPISAKPVTTNSVLEFITSCGQSGCFASPAVWSSFTLTYAKAVQTALKSDLTLLNSLVITVRSYYQTTSSTMKSIPARDLELLLRRLIKRFEMYQGGLLLQADLIN